MLSPGEEHYVLSQEGNNKYYVVKLIREKQKEGILGEHPMLIFNNTPVYIFNRTSFDGTLTTEKKFIKSIKIIKAEIGAQTWGNAAKDGVVEVSTRGKQEKLP